MLSKVPNFIFLCAALTSLGFLIRSFLRIDDSFLSFSATVIYFVLPAIAALALLVGLLLKPGLKVNLAIILVTSVLASFCVDVVLGYLPAIRMTAWQAEQERKLGQSLDRRPALEVVAQRRNAGEAIVPVIYFANGENPLQVDGRDVLLFSGVADSVNLFCNEAGKWQMFKSDEFGFQNPKGLWSQERVQIVIVGDSYAKGTCVEPQESLAGRIRSEYPMTLNLSYSMSGPLMHLAVLREYGTYVRPEVVLWFYYSNDLPDMMRSASNSVLRQYLDPGFSQYLYRKKDRVNKAAMEYAEEIMARYLAGEITPKPLAFERERTSFSRILTLPHLRDHLGFPPLKDPNKDFNWKLYRLIMEQAKELVEGWGGRIHFIYLPSYHELAVHNVLGKTPAYRDRLYEKVMDVADKLGMERVDIREVMRQKASVDDVYRYSGSHYNEFGYQLAAEAVLAHLRGKGYVPWVPIREKVDDKKNLKNAQTS